MKMRKSIVPSIFYFVTILIIFNAMPHVCLSEDPLETTNDSGNWSTIDSGSWTSIEPIPESTPEPLPKPIPKPTPKAAPESEPPPELPPPTPQQLGSCFGGCSPYDQNCKMRCFQEWQKAEGR